MKARKTAFATAILRSKIWTLVWVALILCVFLVDGQVVYAEKSGDAAPTGVGAEKPANKPIEDKWALVVGISKFQNEKINLKFAAKDAKDFAEFLIKEENFAPDHVLLLTDEQATRENILGAIGSLWLPRLANPNDLVVIYLSTHGSPSSIDSSGVNYLVAHDTKVENLFGTGIPMQDLTRMIKGRIHSERIVIILDACHSGATSPKGKGIYRTTNVDAEKIAAGTGQLVISSSAPDQRSWESKRCEGGVFTANLIKSLRDNQGKTSLGEAFKKLKKSVQAEVLRDRAVLQTPVMRSQWKGDEIVLAVKPTDPREGMKYEFKSPASGQDKAPQSGEKTAKDNGVAGVWKSNWGEVTLNHEPIEDGKPVKITGYWYQDGKSKRGVIRSGKFYPKTGKLKFSYWQSWNKMVGSAKLELSADGKRFEGRYKHFGLAGGDWSMWRP